MALSAKGAEETIEINDDWVGARSVTVNYKVSSTERPTHEAPSKAIKLTFTGDELTRLNAHIADVKAKLRTASGV